MVHRRSPIHAGERGEGGGWVCFISAGDGEDLYHGRRRRNQEAEAMIKAYGEGLEMAYIDRHSTNEEFEAFREEHYALKRENLKLQQENIKLQEMIDYMDDYKG